MTATMGPEIGKARRRKEDARLITGRTRWTDNLTLPGMLHLAVLRSPVAHARITSIDTSAVTGESIPVEKSPGAMASDDALSSAGNALFMGSSVVSGEATMLVCATGVHTQIGRVAQSIAKPRSRARRATTKPSPPLLPFPQSTRSLPPFGSISRTTSNTAIPARSMRTLGGMPYSSEARRSMERLWAASAIHMSWIEVNWST